MLLQMIKNTGKKKTEEAYAKLLRKQTMLGFIGGLCLLVLLPILEMSAYQQGMLVGIAFVLFIIAGSSYATQKDPKKCHQAYINAYDERNMLINKLTTTWTLVFLIIVMSFLVLLDGFFGIGIPYRLLLISLIYFCIFCMIGMKTLLNRFL
ncbi:hypothetical protein [Streptococcus halotolerans]|uniref:hypothetical protein n=1 Tax=Streptococcus halotolerans TaxID=1814128 RepID=UPI000788C1F0|nr:hypothetical protein [Streptococcus halotolerans]